MPQPAIFMHTQKTAGSSMVDIAKHAYGSHNVISHGDYQNITKDTVQPVSVYETFGHIPFISGHFGYDFTKHFFHERFSFTFLRDPIERIVSFYYFCRSRNPLHFPIYKLSQELEFEVFLEKAFTDRMLKNHLWNNQAWQLAKGYWSKAHVDTLASGDIVDLATQHLADFSYIGFTESFEEDRDRILSALDIVPPVEKFVSNKTPVRPKVEQISPAAKNLLEELTQLDYVVYREAWNKFKNI